MNAGLFTETFDVVIVHDPQPVALRSFLADGQEAKWILHSHLDISAAQEEVWIALRAHLEQFDGAIFEAPEFARDDVPVRTWIVPPAIDPHSARNMPLPDDVIRTVLQRYGIDPDAPMLCQVSPCDAESDLVGAVETVCALRDQFPSLQLALILTTEPQDPAGRATYDDLARRCADESGVFILGMRGDFGNVELNVFQRAASVVMQRGLRKGFGLWVSDALWKAKPVVAGGAPGLTQQVIDGKTGLIANHPADFETLVARLLRDPSLGARLGDAGRRHVSERFLITRYLRDQLNVLNELHKGA
jgi:trehalose synthase